jgi:hypothetical protein
MQPVCGCENHKVGQRQKLSRAAKTVNRESGNESAIGVGSGGLLGVVDSTSKCDKSEGVAPQTFLFRRKPPLSMA